MASISGVQLKKDSKGKTTHLAIDVHKHPEIIPMLKEKGMLPKTPLQIEAESCLSVDELSDHLKKTIDNFYTQHNGSH